MALGFGPISSAAIAELPPSNTLGWLGPVMMGPRPKTITTAAVISALLYLPFAPEPLPNYGWTPPPGNPPPQAYVAKTALRANTLYCPQSFTVAPDPTFDWFVQPLPRSKPPLTIREATFVQPLPELHYPLGWLPSTTPVRMAVANRVELSIRADQEIPRTLGWLPSTTPPQYKVTPRVAVSIPADQEIPYPLGWLPFYGPVRYTVASRQATTIPRDQEQHNPLGWLPSTQPVRMAVNSRVATFVLPDQEQHYPLGWLPSTQPPQYKTKSVQATTVVPDQEIPRTLGWLPSTTPVRYSLINRQATTIPSDQEQHYPLGWLQPVPPVRPQQNATFARFETFTVRDSNVVPITFEGIGWYPGEWRFRKPERSANSQQYWQHSWSPVLRNDLDNDASHICTTGGATATKTGGSATVTVTFGSAGSIKTGGSGNSSC